MVCGRGSGLSDMWRPGLWVFLLVLIFVTAEHEQGLSDMWTPGLLVLLLILTDVTGEHEERLDVVKMVVKEDDDVILPCSLSTKGNITAAVFDWRKDGQKEVFLYQSGDTYNGRLHGQDEQFRERVSNFQDELKNGNASIKILNTKSADSGNYTCIFPHFQPRQIFNIELIVELIPKDRSHISGASSRPHITKLLSPRDEVLLQCEVQDAFPEPKVEWRDSTGHVSADGEPQVLNIKGHYNVYLKLTVTRTDTYYCVVTQEEIGHQVDAKTFVVIREDSDCKVVIGWLAAALVIVILITVVVILCIKIRKHKCSHANNTEPQPNGVPLLKRGVQSSDPESDLSGASNIIPPKDSEVPGVM